MIDSRQHKAARNVDAILEAAEGMLVRGVPLSFSALAAEAGVSRPTIYSHFPDRARVLAAVVERNVGQAVAAIESVAPGDGDPVDAVRRVVNAGWEPLARHQAIARAVSSEIAVDAMHASHHQVVGLIATLVDRGRSEGAFRTDLPSVWLVVGMLALIHAAATAAFTGQMTSESALDALSASIVDLCVGVGPQSTHPRMID